MYLEEEKEGKNSRCSYVTHTNVQFVLPFSLLRNEGKMMILDD